MVQLLGILHFPRTFIETTIWSNPPLKKNEVKGPTRGHMKESHLK